MNVGLGIVQGLLALAFGLAGVIKLTRPLDGLAAAMPWTRDVPPGLVRFIGAAETLGAIGLVAPALTGIATWLVPLAALGLVGVMLLATGFHITRREHNAIPVNEVLLVLSAIAAYGRWAVVPL